MVAERLQAEDASLQYLVKWQGLPYSEATWESIDDIHGAGGQEAIDEFQVGNQPGWASCTMRRGAASTYTFKNVACI